MIFLYHGVGKQLNICLLNPFQQIHILVTLLQRVVNILQDKLLPNGSFCSYLTLIRKRSGGSNSLVSFPSSSRGITSRAEILYSIQRIRFKGTVSFPSSSRVITSRAEIQQYTENKVERESIIHFQLTGYHVHSRDSTVNKE